MKDDATPIGSISITRARGKWRAFAWRDVPTDTPCGGPLFVIDCDSLGRATNEMLLVIRGERPRPKNGPLSDEVSAAASGVGVRRART